MSSEAEQRPETARLFFALWPPPALAAQLAELAQIAAARVGGRPTRPELMHLTLAFLGKFPLAQLPQLTQIARRIQGAPFALTLDRCAYSARQQLIWAACSNAPAALLRLVADLHAALALAGFIAPARQLAYRPHVTLVRKAQAPAELDVGTPPLIWSCTQFALVRSSQSSLGSQYQQLALFPLGTLI